MIVFLDKSCKMKKTHLISANYCWKLEPFGKVCFSFVAEHISLKSKVNRRAIMALYHSIEYICIIALRELDLE